MPNISRSNPKGLHAPVGRSSHVVGVAPGSRRVVPSGQVGVRPDGSVPENAGEQAEQVVRNIQAVSTAEGLTAADIAKVTTYLTDRAVIPTWQAHREGLLGELEPASTFLLVAGLAASRLIITVDVEAAGDAAVADRRPRAGNQTPMDRPIFWGPSGQALGRGYGLSE